MVHPSFPKVHPINESAWKESNAKQRYRSPRVNLKQWRMLDAVVSCGSFANAAEYLHVSQPAISYTIAKLEELLGVPLLRIEGRKAQITEAGRALLDRSRRLLREASELEDFAESLRQGVCPEVKLAVSTDFPTHALVPALRLFGAHVQSTKVGLMEMSVAEIDNALQDHFADLAIHGYVPAGLQGHLFAEMEYVAVASPGHSLFTLDREITGGDLARETQVTAGSDWMNRTGVTKRSTSGRQQWQVNSFDTAETVLREGLGYGWLPRYRVDESLKREQLKILPLGTNSSYKRSFYLVHQHSANLSVAANYLLEILLNTGPAIGDAIT